MDTLLMTFCLVTEAIPLSSYVKSPTLFLWLNSSSSPKWLSEFAFLIGAVAPTTVGSSVLLEAIIPVLMRWK